MHVSFEIYEVGEPLESLTVGWPANLPFPQHGDEVLLEDGRRVTVNRRIINIPPLPPHVRLLVTVAHDR